MGAAFELGHHEGYTAARYAATRKLEPSREAIRMREEGTGRIDQEEFERGFNAGWDAYCGEPARPVMPHRHIRYFLDASEITGREFASADANEVRVYDGDTLILAVCEESSEDSARVDGKGWAYMGSAIPAYGVMHVGARWEDWRDALDAFGVDYTGLV